jgi:archaemetzincin
LSSLPAATLQVIPVGDTAVPPWLLDELAGRVAARVTLAPPLPVGQGWVDGARGQMRSDAVVDALIDRAHDAPHDPERHWMLAVADADLYAPGKDFVFGEATVGGCCAVIGLARLRTEGGTDPGLFRRRVLTEALHELGHVAGLPHCARERCVMFFSATLGDTDRKGFEPCQACAAALQGLGAKRSA